MWPEQGRDGEGRETRFRMAPGRWPLVAVLVWIATREEFYSSGCADQTINQADIWLSIRQAVYGFPAYDSVLEMWRKELAPALDSGALKAYAKCAVVNRLGIETVSVGCIFPPEQQPAAASDHIIGETGKRAVLRPAGAEFSHEFSEWRDVTFAREDVLRLWPEPAWVGRKDEAPQELFHQREALYFIIRAMGERGSGGHPKPRVALSEKRAREVIRAAIKASDGFISQNGGAKIVRDIDPDFDRDEARRLTKELTGNLKSGPRGPRKNRAG